MRKMIVRIGWTHYAMSPADAMALLALSERMQNVERPKYTGPYVVKQDAGEVIESCEMGDVLEVIPPEPANEPGAKKDPLAIAAPLKQIEGF